MGNTDAVYNYTTQFDLVIKKKVNGDTGKKQEFKFGIFMKQGDSYNKIQEICVTTNDQGEGTSDVISHEIFTSGAKYYIFELDDSGNPIINGEGIVNGVKNSVSYSTNGLSGSVVESVGNTSYIEFLEGSGSTTDLIQSTGKGKASLVIGSTNKIGWNNENQGYVEGRGGCQYSIEKSKVDVTVAADPFPIDFSTEMSNLSTLSENLAKMLPAESSDVKTIYVPIDSSGNVDYQNVLDNGNKIFDDNNAWNDTGASTNGKLLVFNVDCSAAGNNVELQGCRIDGNDPQNWNEKANSVIWNFYTKNGESYSPYTGKITYKGGLGTILAPEATVECISSTNGSVIASSVSHPGCEIHYIKVTDVVNVVKKTVTCTNTPNKGTLTVTKTVEGNGGDKNKEFEFTVTLNDKSIAGMYGDISFENGVATFTLKHGESKNAENLPEGTEYTVTEEDYSSDGYSTTSTGTKGTISQNTSSVAAFTNTRNVETVNISVSKIWDDNNNQDGIRPAEITVQLYANGEKSGEEVSLSAANNWSYTWTKLAKNAGKKTIEYSVDEVKVPDGYTRTVTANGTKTEYTITNTHTPEITSVEGEKTWDDAGNQDGKRPESITVNLLANGTKKESKTVTAGDNWKYSFKDLPKYENGKEITYTVTENAVTGYSTKIDGYNITNSYTPGKTSVTVTKKWVDNDNKSGKRPSEIKVQLYADGKESGSPVTLNEANKWTYTWTELDEKKDGTTIAYTVKEVGSVDGYETSIKGNASTGYEIINTLEPTATPTITPGTKNPTSTPSAENPNTYSGESKKTAVKTGDNTPVGGFVGLLLATAAVALSICYMKRRRR